LSVKAAGAKETRKETKKETKAPPKPQNVLSRMLSLKRLLKVTAAMSMALRCGMISARARGLGGRAKPYAAILSCADSRIAPE